VIQADDSDLRPSDVIIEVSSLVNGE